MRLSTWDPFTEMETVLNRYRPQASKAQAQTMTKADWYPVVDVSENDQAFHLHAELPGVEKDQIKLNVQDGVLTLSGQRASQHENKAAKVHTMERSYGSFVRQFHLPENVDSQKVLASYNFGVLEVEIPKAEPETPKRIDVSIN